MKLFSFILSILFVHFYCNVSGELGLSVQPSNNLILKSTITLSKLQKVSVAWYSLNDTSIKYIAPGCASCDMDAVQQYSHNSIFTIKFQTGKLTNYDIKISRKDIFEKYLKIPHFEFEPILPEKVSYDQKTGNILLFFKFVSGVSDQGASLIVKINKSGQILSAYPHFKTYICGVQPVPLNNGNILTCNGLYSEKGNLLVKYPLAPIQEVYSLNDTLTLVVYDMLAARYQKYSADPDTNKIPMKPELEDSLNIYLYGSSGKYVEQFGRAIIRKSNEYMVAGSIVKSQKLVSFYDRYNQTFFMYSGLNPKKKTALHISKIKELKTRPLAAKFMTFIGRKGLYSFYVDTKGELLGYMVQVPQ